MKVGFDGVLLGAWAKVEGCRRILDVGTGTGLIALMLAQRSKCGTIIDAIDVDQEAADEAADNFRSSPWSQCLSSQCISFDDFSRNPANRYDLIVCNPPYFSGAAGLTDVARYRARHSCSLGLGSLIELSRRLSSQATRLCLILPIELEQSCLAEARRSEWVSRRMLRVRSLPDRAVHRLLLEFGRDEGPLEASSELTIEAEHHVYTDEFRELAKDFYLAF